MLDRRSVLLGGVAFLGGCAAGALRPAGAAAEFVRREGAELRIGARPYRFAGANMWYAAYLGADAPFGNRARLGRELDRLAALGIDNVRILASSEQSPLRGSITPAFRTISADYNETLLRGLDFALAEMGRRGMRAVLYLTNFWEWSGGMMTYVSWTNGGRHLNMNDPAHPWPQFPDFASSFYSNRQAVALYEHYVGALVSRTNTVTGGAYAADPTIMGWQLANEPRPGGSEAVGTRNLPAYLAWISGTARLIKSLDANHLVSTGSEGLKGCIESEECVTAAHAPAEIDYLTAHIWPANWGWATLADLAGTWAATEVNTRQYIRQHIDFAGRLGKPLVIEEFGYPRDGGSFDPAARTTLRDRFYAIIYDAVRASAEARGPLIGSNFWAWSGEGRAARADRRFRPGDAYLGDPPHEPQGWYGVFHRDESSKALIRAQARALA
jgi:mannan endo-1,4-beta-mannosidase